MLRTPALPDCLRILKAKLIVQIRSVSLKLRQSFPLLLELHDLLLFPGASELLDVLRNLPHARKIILWLTLCVKTSLHLIGKVMNLTSNFLCQSDQLVMDLHLLLSCVYSGETNIHIIFVHQ